MNRRCLLAALAAMQTAVNATAQHVDSAMIPYRAAPSPQVFRFGPRLHHLIYETAFSSHNPWNVIQLVAILHYGAQSMALDHDAIVTTGLGNWASERLREWLDSYEG